MSIQVRSSYEQQGVPGPVHVEFPEEPQIPLRRWPNASSLASLREDANGLKRDIEVFRRNLSSFEESVEEVRGRISFVDRIFSEILKKLSQLFPTITQLIRGHR